MFAALFLAIRYDNPICWLIWLHPLPIDLDFLSIFIPILFGELIQTFLIIMPLIFDSSRFASLSLTLHDWCCMVLPHIIHRHYRNGIFQIWEMRSNFQKGFSSNHTNHFVFKSYLEYFHCEPSYCEQYFNLKHFTLFMFNLYFIAAFHKKKLLFLMS